MTTFFLQNTLPVPQLRNLRNTAPFGLLSEQHVLAVNAHPDDELLNGQAIHALAAYTPALATVVLTDGEASTRGNPSFVSQGKRRLESIAALTALGVSPEQQHYFALPDNRLSRPDVFEKAALRLANLALEQGTAAFITTGTNGFGHNDHSAAHHIAVAAASVVHRVNNGVAPAVWGLSERPGEETFFVEPNTKLAALRHHASQFTLKAAGIDAPSKGWVRLGEYDIVGEHHKLLEPYQPLLEVESYNRHAPITHGRLYDILRK